LADEAAKEGRENFHFHLFFVYFFRLLIKIIARNVAQVIGLVIIIPIYCNEQDAGVWCAQPTRIRDIFDHDFYSNLNCQEMTLKRERRNFKYS
jgi:hypothetical protein